MNILLVTWGKGYGHITRCLPIARAAAAAGHRVVIGTEQRLVPRVSEANNEASSEAGTETRIETIARANVSGVGSLGGLGPHWQGWDRPEQVAAAIEEDIALLQQAGADVVLSDTRLTMPAAARLLGIPCVTIAQGTQLPGFIYPGRDRPSSLWISTVAAFNEVLAARGLPRLEHDLREIFLWGDIIVPSIPAFDPIADDPRLARVVHTGPLLWRAPGARGREALRPRDPALFLYEAIDGEPELDAFLHAFQGSRFHLIFAGAHFRSGSRPRDVPAASFEAFVDAADLLPACHASLIHGGYGSCLSALAAGCPALVFSREKPGNRWWHGHQLERMGAGRVLPDVPPDWSAVRELLETDAWMQRARDAARRWADTLTRVDGPRRALAVLLDAVERGRAHRAHRPGRSLP